MPDRFESLVGGLCADLGGLPTFDRRAVEAVAGLLLRVEDARAYIAEYGAVVDSRENPACLTERTASAEIRGWVKERPDLFGPRVHAPGGEHPAGSLKDRFKVV